MDVEANPRYIDGVSQGSDSGSGRSSPPPGTAERSRTMPTGLPGALASPGHENREDALAYLIGRLSAARLSGEDVAPFEAEILRLQQEGAEEDDDAAAAAVAATAARATAVRNAAAAAEIAAANALPIINSAVGISLTLMIQALEAEVERTPECVVPAGDEKGMGYKTDSAFNFAQTVDAKLGEIALGSYPHFITVQIIGDHFTPL